MLSTRRRTLRRARAGEDRDQLAAASLTAAPVKQLRPLRSATITINGATQTFPPDIVEPQRKILAALGINMAY